MKLTSLFPPLFLALLTVISPAQAPQDAQAPADPPITTLKVGTSLVAVSAVVRDATGKPVSGLTRDDFILKQDGKTQPITYFSQSSGLSSSQGSDLPLTLALMVDTSGSQRRYITAEIAAGRVFFRTMMKQPEDRAVLIGFDNQILQLVRITSSVTTLEHGLAYLSQNNTAIGGFGRPGGGTLLYDAVAAVAKIEFTNQLGRRAMVILTDGGDNGSQLNEKKAIEAAQRSDIMIYSVYYSDGGGDLNTLNHLSKATGGRVFTVRPDMSLEQIYAQIADDMRLQYQLGYRPPDSRPNKYHKIDLKAVDKKLVVQAREGYFTPK